MARVAVYGAGSWGTALAIIAAGAGHETALIGRDPREMARMKERRENVKYLPGVCLPTAIEPTVDLSYLQAPLVILSVPSHQIREAVKKAGPYLQRGGTLVNTAKGLEEHTHQRLSQILASELPEQRIAVLSGPSHAEEVGRNMPTAVVVAADSDIAGQVQEMLMTPVFRIYTNRDMVGVELGGALKNVVALCTGMAEGLGFGDNTKAALMTRGLAEIARLGVDMGGDPLTFAGLAGVGDLIVTCTSKHSRNSRAGIALGQGKPLSQVLDEVGMVVEGVRTTRAAFELARLRHISMPIVEEAYKILYEQADPRAAVTQLMQRDKKRE
ncbi:MAG: NAD(P)H-dependent glycerol-3-phosphate dehydrogenase [Peptococcaceae bacterium]|nr:NAD(P)H-dependent glycerol-3-phosphate dehydrogenase [Peptococcaceae bacterium]